MSKGAKTAFIILAVLLILGIATAFWLSQEIKSQPQTHDQPDLPTLDLPPISE